MRTTIFDQIGLDSGALGLAGSVVHPFSAPGHYLGTAISGDVSRGEFEIVVSEEGPPAAQIDLTTTGITNRDSCCGADWPTHRVAVGGYVAFHVGSGHERWAAVVGDPRSRKAEFDSRRLEEGDLFAGTILRPGTYSVRNVFGAGGTELVVRYIRPGREPYQPDEPMRLKMGEQASRKMIRVGPAQGLVFEVTERARIVVELTEPDDGPPQKTG